MLGLPDDSKIRLPDHTARRLILLANKNLLLLSIANLSANYTLSFSLTHPLLLKSIHVGLNECNSCYL